ncbi:MAG: hypothetical protein V4520_01250 [Bacteroidota bacterium]
MEVKKSISARQWWLVQRAKYNIGLIYAGFIAFLLYVILGPIIIEPHEEFEETIFDMAFQGVGYLIMMGVANVFYTLGWVIDAAFNENNSQNFRKRLFALGYWFSFSLPILLILSVMVRFLIWGK